MLLFQNLFSLYLKGRTDRKSGWREIVYLPIHFPNAQMPARARVGPGGAKELRLCLPGSSQEAKYLHHPLLPPRVYSKQEAGTEVKPAREPDDPAWLPGLPSDSLTIMPNACLCKKNSNFH